MLPLRARPGTATAPNVAFEDCPSSKTNMQSIPVMGASIVRPSATGKHGCLLDEDIPLLLGAALRTRGHDVAHVKEVGLRSWDDPDVLAYAVAERRAAGAISTHSRAVFPAGELKRAEVVAGSATTAAERLVTSERGSHLVRLAVRDRATSVLWLSLLWARESVAELHRGGNTHTAVRDAAGDRTRPRRATARLRPWLRQAGQACRCEQEAGDEGAGAAQVRGSNPTAR